ncbi:hypothetical protein RI367_000387 [Sorochytrium milnesiophthora]
MAATTTTTTTLTHNRSLCDASFEGYRLHFLDAGSLHGYQLHDAQGHCARMYVDDMPVHAQLSLEQTMARLAHSNMLLAGHDRHSVYMLTRQRTVLCVRTDMDGSKAEARTVFALPPVEAGNGEVQTPSLRCTADRHVVVADGHGRLFVVDSTAAAAAASSDPSTCCATFELQRPFVLLDACAPTLDERDTLFVLGYHVVTTAVTNDQQGRSRPTTEFVVSLLEISGLYRTDEPARIRVVGAWLAACHPYVGTVDSDLMVVSLGSKSGFCDLLDKARRELYNQSRINDVALLPDFSQIIARVLESDALNEAHGGMHQEAPTALASPQQQQRQYQYAWIQSDTDVTVHVTLPFTIHKSEVHCRISTNALQLHVDRPEPQALPVAVFDDKLWGPVVAVDSVWTLEPHASGSTLTIHLEKQDTKTRWPHILWHDDGVLETVDPSEMRKITENLAKYTVDTPPSSEPAHKHALPGTQAYIPPGEETEDIDMDGEELTVQLYQWQVGANEDTDEGSWFRWTSTTLRGGDKQFIAPAQLFHAFPTAVHRAQSHTSRQNGLTVRCDVDAFVYALCSGGDGPQPAVAPEFSFSHLATFNAFGYVQASKRDRRFTLTSNQAAVVCDTTSYVYVYMHRDNSETSTADGGNDNAQHYGVQYVLDVQSDGSASDTVLTADSTAADQEPAYKRQRVSSNGNSAHSHDDQRIVGVTFVNQRLLCVLCSTGRLLFLSLQ